MGFIQRLFGSAPEQRAASDADILDLLQRGPTAAGLNVTSEVALQSPTVLAAVRAISETSGMLPIAVRQKKGDGWEKVSDHPAAKLLNGFASPSFDATQLRTRLVADAILNRNGGCARVLRARGEPRQLQRLNPTAVSVREDINTGELTYEVSRPTGGPLVLQASDVIHFTVPGWSPDRPMSLIDMARESIAADIVMARMQSRTFAGSGLPQIVLSPKSETISQDALQKALKFFVKQRDENTGDPIILPASFESAMTTVGFQQMQFLELRRLVIEQIYTALRVPGPVIGDLSKGTFSNTEQSTRNFLVYSLLPWFEMQEAAFTRALIPVEQRDTVELEFITEDLLRGDTATRFRAYREASGGAWMSRNEIRELEGRGPVPEGDSLLNQAGQTDASGERPDEPDPAPVA
ncbi:MAG: phage portal protein [Pelagibacterium sp.]|uniref:phage portal protein n=1 Tax=Pelagibacterium sp. TaxID=1967288 RepID=UPI0032EEA368